MNIGIIGAGNIGAALTRRFRAVGHDVDVANSRGPATLADLANETGANAATVERAARENDVVVVTVPMSKIVDLPADLFVGAHANVIVIDTGNYYPRERDDRMSGLEASSTESGWVEQQIGHSVIKAFNTIAAEHLFGSGKARGTPGRIALAVAGDDSAAKATVMELIDQIGFDTVDTGSIEDSWRQQPGSPGYTMDYDAAGVRRALAEAHRERPPRFTGTSNSPGTYDDPK